MPITLYRPPLQAVECLQCSKTGQAETAISGILRRAPAFKGGFLLLAWQGLNVSYGGLLTGSRKACRYLSYGYCRPDSDPRPSTAMESGNHSKNSGGQYHGKKSAYPSTRVQSHNSAYLHRTEDTGAGYSYCLLGGAAMPKTISEEINPLLLLLALSQNSRTPADIERLSVIAQQFAPIIDALAGAAVTLENLAEDMDAGVVDYYGNTDTMRREAEELHQLRHQLTAFIHSLTNSAKEADHGHS